MKLLLSLSSLSPKAIGQSIQFWPLLIKITCLFIVLPILVILVFIFFPNAEIWRHLYETVLLDYATNSILLLMGVAFGTFVLGVGAAWLTTFIDFYGKNFFNWALFLPIAFPVYIMAYIYVAVLEVGGPVQMMLQSMLGSSFGEYWFPEINSIAGACVIFSLSLYPYVYILSKQSFRQLSRDSIDSALILGHSNFQIFTKVILPLSRPTIVASLALVLMETLADFGAVEYLGVPTFTTGIFRVWFGMDNIGAAAGLSACLLLFVVTLLVLEKSSRRAAKFYQDGQQKPHHYKIRFGRVGQLFATMVCASLLLMAFIVPMSFLIYWTGITWQEHITFGFLGLLANSLTIAVISALVIVGIGLLLCMGNRFYSTHYNHLSLGAVKSGYALPGAVVAIGVMLIGMTFNLLGFESLSAGFSWVMSSTVLLVLFAYLTRFSTVAVQTIDSGLSIIEPQLDDSARMLGHGFISILRKIHFPLLMPYILAALMLVFVEVIKELPATLILRPFNFDTLAVKTYEYASDEQLIMAALPALLIVLISLLSVWGIYKTFGQLRA